MEEITIESVYIEKGMQYFLNLFAWQGGTHTQVKEEIKTYSGLCLCSAKKDNILAFSWKYLVFSLFFSVEYHKT